MTQEETLEVLDRLRDDESYTRRVWDALSMAIEAVKESEDCISRQAAVKAIMGTPPEPNYPAFYADIIKSMQARHTRQESDCESSWIVGSTTAKCKKCGHVFPGFLRFQDFCPHCGRKMQGFSEKSIK